MKRYIKLHNHYIWNYPIQWKTPQSRKSCSNDCTTTHDAFFIVISLLLNGDKHNDDDDDDDAALLLVTFVLFSSCSPGVSVSGGNATQIRMLYGFTYNWHINLSKHNVWNTAGLV